MTFVRCASETCQNCIGVAKLLKIDHKDMEIIDVTFQKYYR